MTHSIHVGIGGWTYEPWRGVFYPEGLTQKRELEFASRRLTSIEINGTYYSTFKPDSWMKWRDETPDGFVFSVKASRYCTNRKVLAEMGESMDRFLGQGLTALGDRLGARDIVNASVRLNTGQWTWTAYALNATDETYIAAINSGLRYAGPPRQYGVNLTRTF